MGRGARPRRPGSPWRRPSGFVAGLWTLPDLDTVPGLQPSAWSSSPVSHPGPPGCKGQSRGSARPCQLGALDPEASGVEGGPAKLVFSSWEGPLCVTQTLGIWEPCLALADAGLPGPSPAWARMHLAPLAPSHCPQWAPFVVTKSPPSSPSKSQQIQVEFNTQTHKSED